MHILNLNKFQGLLETEIQGHLGKQLQWQKQEASIISSKNEGLYPRHSPLYMPKNPSFLKVLTAQSALE